MFDYHLCNPYFIATQISQNMWEPTAVASPPVEGFNDFSAVNSNPSMRRAFPPVCPPGGKTTIFFHSQPSSKIVRAVMNPGVIFNEGGENVA